MNLRSVALDNGELLRALAQKHYIAKCLKYEDISSDGDVDDTGSDDNTVVVAPTVLQVIQKIENKL